MEFIRMLMMPVIILKTVMVPTMMMMMNAGDQGTNIKVDYPPPQYAIRSTTTATATEASTDYSRVYLFSISQIILVDRQTDRSRMKRIERYGKNTERVEVDVEVDVEAR